MDALSVAAVRLALDDQAERMLGTVPVALPAPQAMEWVPSHGKERDE